MLKKKDITLVGTMRQRRKGLDQEMIEDIKQRPVLSTVVWFEEEGDLSLTVYKVKTKSRGDHTVLVLSSYEDLETLGVTKDDGQKKSAIFKFYDFTKIGTDVSGKYKFNYLTILFIYSENHNITVTMSPSCADPVMGLNIYFYLAD